MLSIVLCTLIAECHDVVLFLTATCQTGEWQCFDGGCIPGEAKCDNYPHCEDESDEQNCKYLIHCLQKVGDIKLKKM